VVNVKSHRDEIFVEFRKTNDLKLRRSGTKKHNENNRSNTSTI
jgi:hypothetical protein